MRTISLRLDDDVKTRWEQLAQRHGLNQSQLMREAIVEKLEELEDFYVVRERSMQRYTPVSSDELWRRAGLED